MRIFNHKISKILFVGLLATTTSLAPSLARVAVASPAAAGALAGATSGGSPLQGQVNFDAHKFAESAARLVNKAENRDAFVKGLRNEAYYNAGAKYNVMVFNLNQDHWQNFQNVIHYENREFEGIPYGIWVFEKGEFTNKGDGGYINWAFAGKYDRPGEGKYLNFR